MPCTPHRAAMSVPTALISSSSAVTKIGLSSVPSPSSRETLRYNTGLPSLLGPTKSPRRCGGLHPSLHSNRPKRLQMASQRFLPEPVRHGAHGAGLDTQLLGGLGKGVAREQEVHELALLGTGLGGARQPRRPLRIGDELVQQ